MRIGSSALVLGSLMITSTAVLADTKKRADTPEAGSGYKAKAAKTLKTRGVSSANPLASEAGHAILKAGGSAVDAAIAVQMVLNLVEPQSSGIGGGAFMLHHDGQKLQMFDGREAAPHLSHEELFVYNHGELMAFEEAMVGGRAVGVPGTLRMLEQAHRQHGKLPWAQLFQPAIKLSENGFKISPRLHAMLLADRPLRKDLNASAFFYRPNGQPLPVGHVLKNPGLAQVLKLIAKDGADAFHQGPLAQTIINKVQQHSYNPGVMTMRDMTNYRPIQREALCFSHAASTGPVQICGAGAPSSGLIATGQILGILSNTPASKEAPSSWADRNTVVPSLNWLHHYNEAARLAFADRALYVADPDFTKAPGGDWNKMLAPTYLQQRASLVQNQRMGNATAGQPGGAPMALAPMADQTEYGTSHISIVDGLGNTVSMTTSIESAFGSRVMVNMGQRGGFLLNNQLTDFSMAIPQSFIQELLARADVVDIVGRYVQLKKGGANYMGLCPFHGEKSPSFSVSPTKQFFHCFGCGKNGNAIGFLMEHAGMNFVEAVKDLAQTYGMPVPEDDASPQDRERAARARERQATLSDVLEKAAEAYRKHLKNTPPSGGIPQRPWPVG
jgi:gamma-glutamyltranspeptidase / glutathione hydrolase